jgi:hypothetical protein
MTISGQLDEAVAGHSAHETVVEYAVRFMFKRKSPAAAAKLTAEKLGGSTNMVIGGGRETLVIDPKRLEAAIWDRLVAHAIENFGRVKAGKEDFALGMTADHFKLSKANEAKLEKLVVKRIGRPLRTDGGAP